LSTTNNDIIWSSASLLAVRDNAFDTLDRPRKPAPKVEPVTLEEARKHIPPNAPFVVGQQSCCAVDVIYGFPEYPDSWDAENGHEHVTIDGRYISGSPNKKRLLENLDDIMHCQQTGSYKTWKNRVGNMRAMAIVHLAEDIDGNGSGEGQVTMFHDDLVKRGFVLVDAKRYNPNSDNYVNTYIKTYEHDMAVHEDEDEDL
jgi:hypothetical protein